MTTIAINITDLKETPKAMVVSFTLADVFTAEGSKIKIGDTVSITTATDGTGSISLSVGNYVVRCGSKAWQISVSGTGTANLIDLIALEPQEALTRGLPSGGTSGQVLSKNSGENYDVEWADPSGGGGGVTDLSYTASPTEGQVNSSTGTDAVIPSTDGTNAGLFLPSEKTKLAGIATGATANSSDAYLLERANHTGTQAISTVTGLQTALDNKQNSLGFTPANSAGQAFTGNISAPKIGLGTGASAPASLLETRTSGGTLSTTLTELNGSEGLDATVGIALRFRSFGSLVGNIYASNTGLLTISNANNSVKVVFANTGVQMSLVTLLNAGDIFAPALNLRNVGGQESGFFRGSFASEAQESIFLSISRIVIAEFNKNFVAFSKRISAPQISTTKQTLTPTGSTLTIDWNNGSIIDLPLSMATDNVTLTLQNPVSAASYLIEVTNVATPRNLIFPVGTLQADGGGNTYTGTANQKDIIAVLWDGTQYLISVSKNYS